MQPISSCLFLYFTLLCEAIYFPGDEVTKPPKRREKLPWYQHHRHTNKYPDDTVASVPTHLDRQGSVLSTNRPLSVDSNKPRSQGSWLDSPGNELEEETPLGLGGDAGGSGMETEDETMFSADVRTVPATLVKPTLSSSQDSVTSQLGPGECPPGATGQFTYPPDCGRFLNCWKGRGFVQPCAPATLFNPDTLECDFPAKVKCVESTIEEWQTFYTPSTHREGKHLPVSTTTTPPIVPKSDCPMEGDTGLASHPNDCSKYLNCWNGEAHIQSCGPGTLFNPVTLVCDYPYNVECGEHRELQEVSTNTDPEIILPTSSSTPTSTSTISTAPVTMQPHTHQSMSTSGQVLRLRGGSGPWEGYVEVQGSTPGWGLVCDQIHGWNILEANVVCKQLGYHRGAEFSWQGRPTEDDTLKITVGAVTCSGNEATLAGCRLSHNVDTCLVARDAVGVRCYLNSASQCQTEEVNFDGKCYFLVNGEDGGFTHGEAIHHCQSQGGHLLDINSQAESDFISEWLVQLHPHIPSIITSGVGVSVFGRSVWIWEGSEQPFSFTKWWTGWTNDVHVPPSTKDRPLCVEARRLFPCQHSYYSSAEDGSLCGANYFYWDIEDCAVSHTHPYICEKPHLDIGCVAGVGQEYAGAANVTINGMPCIHWDLEEVVPYLRFKVSEAERTMSLTGHNYCRNVGGTEGHPWCFVGPRGMMELCDIPTCFNSGAKQTSANTSRCGPKQFECAPAECIASAWVCDGEKDCSNGHDEQSCTGYLEEFSYHGSKRLEGHNVEKWLHTDVNTCAKHCLEALEFTCLSFSFHDRDGVCLLSDSNVGLTGHLRQLQEWEYYELKSKSIHCDNNFTCDNQKCISASSVCDGRNDCDDGSDEIECSIRPLDFEIRLSGGNSSNEGRVEVKVFGEWGSVCDDLFDLRDAGVVCRELGFTLGAAEYVSHSHYGSSGGTPIYLVDDLQCLGNETSIRECSFNGWGVHDCGAEEEVGVVCRVPGLDCAPNHWPCDFSRECIPIAFLCDHVADCDDGSDEDATHCQSPLEIRLVGGSAPTEGRIEVRHHGVWGTVCDDDFTETAASVICRSLKFGGPAEARKNGAFGSGVGQIWLDQLLCVGNESSLGECLHSDWGQHNCRHDEDAAVVCSAGDVIQPLDQPLSVVPVVQSSLSVTSNILPADCGARYMDQFDVDDRKQRVIGGGEVIQGSYPWQASVRVRTTIKSVHWCGAVVISPLHVLTAGHCLQDYTKEAYFVRVGDYDAEADDGTEQELNIDEIYFHEEFNRGVRLNNDIALIKLKSQGIRLGADIQPICLPPSNLLYSPGLNCTISGWGSVKSAGSGYSRTLRAIWIPVLPVDTCKASFVYGEKAIGQGMFCAGHLEGGMDSCQGDSGGPMACLYEGHFTLFGITSWGHGCGRPNKPGVYSNISFYRDWIDLKLRDSMSGR